MERIEKTVIGGRCLYVGELGNIYRASADGLVPFAKHLRKDGYEYIQVQCNLVRRKLSVHRLVAYVFLSNPNGKPQVNHKDGNTRNNRADNLEWVSGSDNQLHSRYVLGNTTGFKDKAVICIETGEEFVSTRDAWRKTGINYSHISECASGKRKTAGGHRWVYGKEESVCATTET